MSSDSSSTSDSGDEHFLNIILPETLRSHPKNENYAEDVIPSYTEDEFLEHFKVPREILNNLAQEFQQSEFYPKKDTGMLRLSPEKCLWTFCWYATHEAASFRDVSDRFNIAISTLYNIIGKVGLFLSHKSPTVITWPTSQDEKNLILEEFSQKGFPGVIGCMDGTHIRIDKPHNDPDSYLNRKKFYSIQVKTYY